MQVATVGSPGQVESITTQDIANLASTTAGISRQIIPLSSSTTAAGSAMVDYTYLCAGTMTLTMPSAVGNKDRYTIKNVGTGTVTVATTGGETIDGGLTAVLGSREPSIDLESDGTNWNII